MLWTLWYEKNKRVHEKKARSKQEIISYVFSYLQELDNLVEKKLTNFLGAKQW